MQFQLTTEFVSAYLSFGGALSILPTAMRIRRQLQAMPKRVANLTALP
jgi:hypothetical protein